MLTRLLTPPSRAVIAMAGFVNSIVRPADLPLELRGTRAMRSGRRKRTDSTGFCKDKFLSKKLCHKARRFYGMVMSRLSHIVNPPLGCKILSIIDRIVEFYVYVPVSSSWYLEPNPRETSFLLASNYVWTNLVPSTNTPIADSTKRLKFCKRSARKKLTWSLVNTCMSVCNNQKPCMFVNVETWKHVYKYVNFIDLVS